VLSSMALDEKLLRLAESAAREAGLRLVKLFRSGRLTVRPKYDYPGSIVTNADHEAEKIILGTIKKSRIRSAVSSEEAGKLDFGSQGIVWAVDPLDGTLNYVKRIPYFAVSIGVLVSRRTRVGVIYNPFLSEMFTAVRGKGASMNGKRIHASQAGSLRGSSIIFDWWNPEPSIPKPLLLAKRLYYFTRTLRSPGSVALNLCSVACGRFDGMVTVFRKAPIYETAAGCLIAEEAGAKVTNSTGESWEDFSNSLIVGGERVHRQMMRVICR